MDEPQRQISVSDGETGLFLSYLRVEATGDQLQISLSNSDWDPPQLNDIVAAEAVKLNGIMPLTDRVTRMRTAITGHLRARGYVVDEMNTDDLTLNFETDMESGMTVARFDQAATQIFLGSRKLARSIQQSITEKFLQLGVDLCRDLDRFVEIGDHVGAAEAVAEGVNNGVFVHRNTRLLDAVRSIDETILDPAGSKLLRRTRVAFCAHHKRYDLAETDARALIESGDDFTLSERASLESVLAIAAEMRGEMETAISIWRRLTRRPDVLDAPTRAWIWRNLSLALPLTSSEASQAAKLSADAFLEAGDKTQAVTSLMRLIELLGQQNPGEIASQLDAAVALIDQHGLIGDELRAAAHHLRGNRLAQLGRHEEALAAAKEAIRLREAVIGVEDQLISSLHLASLESRATNDDDSAEYFAKKANDLEIETESSYFSKARRIQDLLSDFKIEKANQICEEAELSGNARFISAAGVVSIMSNPALDDEIRLGRLEVLHGRLTKAGAKDRDLHSVQIALATVLRSLEQHDRAIVWMRRILGAQPLDFAARQMLIASLWAQEAWHDAAGYLKSEIDRHGDAPGLLFAYGRSLFNAGDLTGAITALTRALKVVGDDTILKGHAENLRHEAMNLGGSFTFPPPIPTSAPVLSDEVETALRDFAKFVADAQRMRFWRRSGSEHKWIDAPERFAQDLLFTSVKTHFKQRVSAYQEVAAGPGRLDILLKLEGGLTVVIELKMCGSPYSSTYAASGEEQIRTYMTAHDANLGYLVIFDARYEDFGRTVLPEIDMGRHTVFEIFVDVRPRIAKRKTAPSHKNSIVTAKHKTKSGKLT